MGERQSEYYANNPKFAVRQFIETYMEKDIIQQLVTDYAIKNAIDPLVVAKLVGYYFRQ